MTSFEDTALETHEENSPEPTKTGELLPAHAMARRALFTKSLAIGASVIGLNLLDGPLTASAAAVSAWQTAMSDTHAAPATTQLHSCGRATNGKLYHTIRFPSGSWQSAFGNVNDQESNGGTLRFTDVDCAGVVDNLHVTALAKDGIIWHTIRFANGSWAPSFGNVNNQESNGHILHFTGVSCAGTTSNKLHVTALTRSGLLWHTIRFANGSWAPSFGNVNNQENNGNARRFIAIDCAIIGENLHVCGIDKNGIIWHTIRFADGSWAPSFGNVNNQESNGHALSFTDVGCASIGDTLHVTALDQSGVLWHTIRFANGSWQTDFGNVNNQESNGNTLRFTEVDCANVADSLHVTTIGQNNVLWHTIRFANGSWQSASGNVNHQESNGNTLRFTAIGTSGVV